MLGRSIALAEPLRQEKTQHPQNIMLLIYIVDLVESWDIYFLIYLDY